MDHDGDLSRRQLLAASLALPLAAACARTPAPPGTRVPLAAIPAGARLRVLHGEEPVELRREGGEVRARSLWCTHTGCEVRWIESESIYRCVCHDATFGADGRVLSGPPPRPLRDLEVVLEGDRILLPARPPDVVARAAPFSRSAAAVRR
jgi:cytochrome b6-f complex iron-sulfur subunit